MFPPGSLFPPQPTMTNKALQDLIRSEKDIVTSLQHLSATFQHALEAMQAWGRTEGDDLRDVLDASGTMLKHFTTVLSDYATGIEDMRGELKAVRAKEWEIEDLTKQLSATERKAEDAGRKLSKLPDDHKNYYAQQMTLATLRSDIDRMSSGLAAAQSQTYDHKRTVVRQWLGVKFGGLLKLCETGTILAEYGKLTAMEISEEITWNSSGRRPMYNGQANTKQYVEEAHSCVAEVVLSTIPSVGFRDRRQYEQMYQGEEILLDGPTEKPKGSVNRKSTLMDIPEGASLPYKRQSSDLSPGRDSDVNFGGRPHSSSPRDHLVHRTASMPLDGKGRSNREPGGSNPFGDPAGKRQTTGNRGVQEVKY